MKYFSFEVTGVEIPENKNVSLEFEFLEMKLSLLIQIVNGNVSVFCDYTEGEKICDKKRFAKHPALLCRHKDSNSNHTCQTQKQQEID